MAWEEPRLVTATTCDATVASPAPNSSRRGKPSAPKISTAFSASLTTVTATAIRIGVRVSRSARSTLSITIAAAKSGIARKVSRMYGPPSPATASLAPSARISAPGASTATALVTVAKTSDTSSDARIDTM